MRVLLIFFSLIYTSSILADDFHVLNLDELSIDYKNYARINDKARNLLIYPEHPKEGINININTSVLSYGYFNSTIESLTTSSQYRGIGLQVCLGLHLSDSVDIGYYHHSQHVIDREIQGIPIFPVEDAIQIKIYFYRKNNKDSIF